CDSATPLRRAASSSGSTVEAPSACKAVPPEATPELKLLRSPAASEETACGRRSGMASVAMTPDEAIRFPEGERPDLLPAPAVAGLPESPASPFADAGLPPLAVRPAAARALSAPADCAGPADSRNLSSGAAEVPGSGCSPSSSEDSSPCATAGPEVETATDPAALPRRRYWLNASTC